MHDDQRPGSPEAEDRQDQIATLRHLMATHPDTLRLPDLIRDLGDPDDFAHRDRIERAVTVLVRDGLLYEAEGDAVLPTRAAVHAFEAFGS
ncbi:MAG TPA: hypothetical protein VJU14_10270 [Solirubrobacterales bacterium]|nr:hypothetical protein [Solirubrobacterales bacterium]